jgi:hypothetical protein
MVAANDTSANATQPLAHKGKGKVPKHTSNSNLKNAPGQKSGARPAASVKFLEQLSQPALRNPGPRNQLIPAQETIDESFEVFRDLTLALDDEDDEDYKDGSEDDNEEEEGNEATEDEEGEGLYDTGSDGDNPDFSRYLAKAQAQAVMRSTSFQEKYPAISQIVMQSTPPAPKVTSVTQATKAVTKGAPSARKGPAGMHLFLHNLSV